MAEIPQNPPSTAQISASDPQKIEVNLYWTIPVTSNTVESLLHKKEAHHFWMGRISILNGQVTLKFSLESYRKYQSGSGRVNSSFKANVTCSLYVNNVFKVTRIKKNEKMKIGYSWNGFGTRFNWATDQVLNPEAPGVPQNLKIHFKVTYPKTDKYGCSWQEPQKEADQAAKPQFIFEDFVFSPELSDLDILTDTGEVIKAHKIILAGKSPVFARMFLGPFVESKDPRLNIDDFKGEIVKLMLRFVYTGDIGSKDLEDVMQLLEIADKYGILELKDLCEAEIKGQLKMDNLMEMLGMVFEGMLQNAKGILVEFIIKNLNECKKMDDFKKFMRGERAFAAELFVAEVRMARMAINSNVEQEA